MCRAEDDSLGRYTLRCLPKAGDRSTERVNTCEHSESHLRFLRPIAFPARSVLNGRWID